MKALRVNGVSPQIAARRAQATVEFRRIAMTILAASPFVAADPAWSQESAESSERPGLQFSIGVRTWWAQWDSWNVGSIATGVAVGNDRFEVVESVKSKAELAVIPFGRLQYGPAFIAASAMSTTDYTLHEAGTPGGFDVQSSRSEFDVNLGYVFSSGVNVTLGGKQISQRFGPDEYKWRGPVLGVGASPSLGSGWGLYFSLGVGKLKGTFPRPDAAGQTSFDADYNLAEAGFTYVFPSPMRGVQAVLLTAGYRMQRMATKDYALAVTSAGQAPRPNTTGELVDTTQGFVLGLQGRF